MKYGLYALGKTQWACLRVLLDDGGQLTTADIAEELGHTPKRIRKALRALRERNLLSEEVIKSRPPVAVWSLNVARTKETA